MDLTKLLHSLRVQKYLQKKICEKYEIPTAQFGVFDSIEAANKYLEKANKPIVIKADGLAAGKGVYICEDTESAKNAVVEIFNGKFGKAEKVSC